jgi:hypothetical protein
MVEGMVAGSECRAGFVTGVTISGRPLPNAFSLRDSASTRDAPWTTETAVGTGMLRRAFPGPLNALIVLAMVLLVVVVVAVARVARRRGATDRVPATRAGTCCTLRGAGAVRVARTRVDDARTAASPPPVGAFGTNTRVDDDRIAASPPLVGANGADVTVEGDRLVGTVREEEACASDGSPGRLRERDEGREARRDDSVVVVAAVKEAVTVSGVCVTDTGAATVVGGLGREPPPPLPAPS